MPTREATLLPSSTIVDFASNILNSLVQQRDKLMRKDFASNILNSLVQQRDKLMRKDFASNIPNSLAHQRDKLMRKDFASNILNSLAHQLDKKPLSHRQRIFLSIYNKEYSTL
jgi:hypothetical protein